jgi:hypothetical protein
MTRREQVRGSAKALGSLPVIGETITREYSIEYRWAPVSSESELALSQATRHL